MLETLAAITLAAIALTAVSLVLAQLVPDRYDDLQLSRVRLRKR